MQEKLEEYRLRKKRKAKFEEIKGKIKYFLMLGTGIGITEQIKRESHVVELEDEDAEDKKRLIPLHNIDDHSTTEDEHLLLSTDDEQPAIQLKVTDSLITAELTEGKCLKYTLWAVYSLFWCTLYIIAIELKFGIVFLMLSALFGIYFNTRTGPKRRNEISAYSVFNQNCESIDGTLKAEQFEREMRYGAGSVR